MHMLDTNDTKNNYRTPTELVRELWKVKHRVVDELKSKFPKKHQSDAHELVLHLIDQVEEALKNLDEEALKKLEKKKPRPLTDGFKRMLNGEQYSRFVCQECEHEWTKEPVPFYNLILAMEQIKHGGKNVPFK